MLLVLSMLLTDALALKEFHEALAEREAGALIDAVPGPVVVIE